MPTAKKKVGRAKKVKEETETPDEGYTLVIKLGDKTLEGHGTNAYQALSSIERPIKITTKAFVSMTDGKRAMEAMYMPMKAKRLFFPMAQHYLAKQLEFLMK